MNYRVYIRLHSVTSVNLKCVDPMWTAAALAFLQWCSFCYTVQSDLVTKHYINNRWNDSAKRKTQNHNNDIQKYFLPENVLIVFFKKKCKHTPQIILGGKSASNTICLMLIGTNVLIVSISLFLFFFKHTPQIILGVKSAALKKNCENVNWDGTFFEPRYYLIYHTENLLSVKMFLGEKNNI